MELTDSQETALESMAWGSVISVTVLCTDVIASLNSGRF